MLAIRLPEEVEKRLDDLARRTGRTKTFYVREAILEHLKNLESSYQTGKAMPQSAPTSIRIADSSGVSSFTSRWKGRLQPALKSDDRYQSLAKKYL